MNLDEAETPQLRTSGSCITSTGDTRSRPG